MTTHSFFWKNAICLFAASTLSLKGATERTSVDLQYVEGLAQDLAQKEYVSPPDIPPALQEVDYDEYRAIRFNPIKALWTDEKLPFRIEFEQ